MIVRNDFCDRGACARGCWRGLCPKCGGYTAVHQRDATGVEAAAVGHVCGRRPGSVYDLEIGRDRPLRREAIDRAFRTEMLRELLEDCALDGEDPAELFLDLHRPRGA